MVCCYSCFKQFDEKYEICPHCGEVYDDKPNQPIDIYPGTMLHNRYILGQSVGQGGFGIVYKAYDTKLEVVVAIKEFFSGRLATRAPGDPNIIVLKSNVDEFNYRKERLLAESRYMAKFSKHKSIVNVFDFFEENNTAYIVMEYLDGESLSHKLKSLKAENNGYISVDETLKITKQIAIALDDLHKANIIHRDVAPDNIWLSSNGSIKLLDLGAAKLADAKEDVIDKITKVGYTPPEQYADYDNVGPTNDVYALGATMYKAATGVLPCESTNRKEGKDELKAPRELNKDINENVNNIILKAMAIEPHMRFKNMQDFIKALEGNMKVLSIEEEKKFRKRKKVSGISIACALVVLIAGLCLNSWNKQKKAELLDPTTITVWYSLSEGSNEETAMNEIKKDFESNFEGVKIDLVAIPDAEYGDKLSEAAKNDSLPNVFESTNASDDVIEKAVSLENLSEIKMFKDYILSSDFEKSDKKQLTLAVEAPVAFVITNGPVSFEYKDDTFKDISDFEGVNIAYDKDDAILTSNFGDKLNSLADKNTFLSDNPSSAVLLGTTLDINTVKNTNSAFEWKCVYYDGGSSSNEATCNSLYEWSMGKGDKKQQRAAERLLAWMTGDVYQQYLLMSYSDESQYGWMSVNSDCVYEMADIDSFAGFYKVGSNVTCKIG